MFLFLSFPSVWLCQANSEREETLTNPERPGRAEMEGCPDQEVGDRQGLGGGPRPPLVWSSRKRMWHTGPGEGRENLGCIWETLLLLVTQHILYS